MSDLPDAGANDPASPGGNDASAPAGTTGTTDSGGGTDDQTSDVDYSEPVAETNETAAPGIPYTLPANLGAFNSARSPSAFNALSLNDAQPIVQPPLTIWKGTQTPWVNYFMRPPGQRTSATLGDNDNWVQNGCHPLCLAMLLDWWQFKNQDTANSLTFPFPTDSAGPPAVAPEPPIGPADGEAQPPTAITPLVMCRRLFGTPFVPALAGSNGKFNVDHIKLQKSVVPTDLDDGGTAPRALGATFQGGVSCTFRNQIWPMQTVTYSNNGSPADLKSALKYLLELGPIMIQLRNPAHFVVVRGYRDDIMYICDPGDIINSPTEWGPSSAMTTSAHGMVAVDCSSTSMIYVQKTIPADEYNANPDLSYWQDYWTKAHPERTPPTSRTFHVDDVTTATVGNKPRALFRTKNLSWLTNILTVEAYYFNDFAVHPEWNDRTASPP